MSEVAEDRIALVTGASRGLGKAMAVELASRGNKVIVNYSRNSDAAEKVVATIEEQGGEAIAVATPGTTG